MNESDQSGGHHHTKAEERLIREAALDDTIAASFPASDPPSTDPNPDADDAAAERPSTDGDTQSER